MGRRYTAWLARWFKNANGDAIDVRVVERRHDLLFTLRAQDLHVDVEVRDGSDESVDLRLVPATSDAQRDPIYLRAIVTVFHTITLWGPETIRLRVPRSEYRRVTTSLRGSGSSRTRRPLRVLDAKTLVEVPRRRRRPAEIILEYAADDWRPVHERRSGAPLSKHAPERSREVTPTKERREASPDASSSDPADPHVRGATHVDAIAVEAEAEPEPKPEPESVAAPDVRSADPPTAASVPVLAPAADAPPDSSAVTCDVPPEAARCRTTRHEPAIHSAVRRQYVRSRERRRSVGTDVPFALAVSVAVALAVAARMSRSCIVVVIAAVRSLAARFTSSLGRAKARHGVFAAEDLSTNVATPVGSMQTARPPIESATQCPRIARTLDRAGGRQSSRTGRTLDSTDEPPTAAGMHSTPSA